MDRSNWRHPRPVDGKQEGNWRKLSEVNANEPRHLMRNQKESSIPRGFSPVMQEYESSRHSPNSPPSSSRSTIQSCHRPRYTSPSNNYSKRTSNPRDFQFFDFKKIEELVNNNDLNDVILSIIDKRNGFENTLKCTDISNDTIVLIMRLLSKICGGSIIPSKISILQMALSGPFRDTIMKYISTIAIQGTSDRNKNKYFWSNPEEFLNNIVEVMRMLHDTVPTSSCQYLQKILKSMKLSIPNIETEQSVSISSELKEIIKTLYKDVEGTLEDMEGRKEVKTAEGDGTSEPPNSIREISIYPTHSEVTLAEYPFLRPNIVKGPYQSIEHYLDVQFRLLREDFIGPLRYGICKYIDNPRDKWENIHVYKGVRFTEETLHNDLDCYYLKWDPQKKYNIDYSQKFMFGSLLCFTKDNFATVLFGKVVGRDKELLQNGGLMVGFEDGFQESMFSEDYLMIESTTYFEPYFYVLTSLQNMMYYSFPMQRYIIQVEKEIFVPKYLLQIDPPLYTIEKEKFCPLDWDDRRFFDLNDSQHEAFKACLTQELAIIQGPPGTGKTFLGLKIVKTLLKNKDVWHNDGPILIISFTNHALDQFLEGLLPLQNMIRVGGQSKNTVLDKYNIKHHRERLRRDNTMDEFANLYRKLKSNLKVIKANRGIIHFSHFQQFMPHRSRNFFCNLNVDSVISWLFDTQYQSLDGNEQYIHMDMTGNSEELDDKFNIMKKPVFIICLDDIECTIEYYKEQLCYITSDETLEIWERHYYENEMNFLIEQEQEFHETLKMRLQQKEIMSSKELPDFVDYENPYNIPIDCRWHLYFHWLGKYTERMEHMMRSNLYDYQERYRERDILKSIMDARIMKSALVVGMTTTSAARLRETLKLLGSPILIVEEAAEVLESHIVCSLSSQCKHLILIGDHQQLKPNTANYMIETKYKLGISLFERMVNNEMPYHTLNIQHRMRPEISSLICPSIYPNLVNHISVMGRPSVQGVQKPVYFIDHQEEEQLCSDNSKKNVHEANFLLQFAEHLILNGHEPENITILAAYLGQMYEMQRIQKAHVRLTDVRIAVLDNYQGEECDIILLSLVRNNKENNVGFLKLENRVCVALSRAKIGLYIMGNMSLLVRNSKIWPKVKDSLEKMDAIGPYLPLCCQAHPQNVMQIRQASDFLKYPEGGCNLVCGLELSCGHICKRLCHVYDMEHFSYRCREKCPRKGLSCNHFQEIECQLNNDSFKCRILVNTTLPCGHNADKPCYLDVKEFQCPYPCEIRVEPCGHACMNKCHIFNDRDHLSYRCKKPCNKDMSTCSMPDGKIHKCDKPCFEKCSVDCDKSVVKQRTCSHMLLVECHIDVEKITCTHPCNKQMPCGHECQEQCWAPCNTCNREVEKLIPGCNHKVMMMCSKIPDRAHCSEKCPRLLKCGHPCENLCKEQCTNICKVIIDHEIEAPCGHIIEKMPCYLKDIENYEMLLSCCKKKCETKLLCGHMCSGNCSDCFQGRVHQRCQQKCGSILICNHECPVPCRVDCKPCMKDCEYRCPHSKCGKRCGDPCTACTENCQRRCSHQECTNNCSELCNVPPCKKRCNKLKDCGHPCVGFCGDPCPSLCRVCDKDELTEVFLGNEDEEGAIYVMLSDCKHIFEAQDMEKWLNMDSNEIKTKVCPKCRTFIRTTMRYSDDVKKSMKDIAKVKEKYYGSRGDNNKLRIELQKDISGINEDVNFIPRKVQICLNNLAKKLTISKISRKSFVRQDMNKTDLHSISSKIGILKTIIKIYNKTRAYKGRDKSEDCANLIVAILMRQDQITEQEIEDINLELNRFSRLVQYETLCRCSDLPYISNKSEDVRDLLTTLEKTLTSQNKFVKESDDIAKTTLEELKKLTKLEIAITERERVEIVQAIGMKPGHWFKCPNGHPYVITECGGAMQISKCPECDAPIGGTDHRLLPGQIHAGDMDRSEHPAWSEAANMGNYYFPF